MTKSTTTITANSRRGPRTVESPYSLDQAQERLRQLYDAGELRGDFAASLADTTFPTDRQAPWIHILVVEHEAKASAAKADPVLLPNIARMLRTAREAGLKTPKVLFPAGGANERGTIRFATAGGQSSNPGRIHVTDGGAFGSNEYYGRLDAETGQLISNSPTPPAVLAALHAIDADPSSAFAQVSGWLVGCCCYCAAALTTDASRGAGYGPVCAKRYGLPWGAETASEAPTLADIESALRTLPEAQQSLLRPALDAKRAEDLDEAAYRAEIDAEAIAQDQEPEEAYDGEVTAENALGINGPALRGLTASELREAGGLGYSF